MPQLVKKRRSGWAVLAAGALVASLLAVGTAPAGADPAGLRVSDNQHVDHPAGTSACVGDALDDHMFTDVSDAHAFGDAIDCIAYYGITNGTGDGSTFGPNDDVTRAQMAVFVARAADAAGVDLGDANRAEFDDIDDIWAEAQDAINGLASEGMIPSGGEFRPGDAITRAEMATFLVGLLVEASPMVTRDPRTADRDEADRINLGPGGNRTDVRRSDWFADARAAVPSAVDTHISVLYELGVTRGAERIGRSVTPTHVLVTPSTHAYAPVRLDNPSVVLPQKLSFDEDGTATFSIFGLPDREAHRYQDKSDVNLTIQHYRPGSPDTADVPLPLNYNPNGTVNRGQMAAFITRALDHTSVRPAGVSSQLIIYDDGDHGYVETTLDMVVSVRTEDFQPVANAVVDLFRTDTPGVDLAFRADGSCREVGKIEGRWECEIDGTDLITGGSGDTKVNLGSTDTGGTTVWAWTGENEDTVEDGTEPYRLDVPEFVGRTPVQISVSTEHGGKKAHQGSSVAFTLQIQDIEGEALHGPYRDDLKFVDGNGNDLAFTDSTAQPIPAESPDRSEYRPFYVLSGEGEGADDVNSGDFTGVFSTEGSLVGGAEDITIKVKPASKYVAADGRGATSRVRVIATDQYGDPITGVDVRLRTDRRADDPTSTDPLVFINEIGGDHYLAVDRDGSHTFGYKREGATADTDPLTGDLEFWDHDGDGCTQALIDDTDHACNDGGTLAVTQTGTGTIEWAAVATPTSNSSDGGTPRQIFSIDKETNTIFVGTDANNDGDIDENSAVMVSYDDNDRFDFLGDEAGAVSYGRFEQRLSKRAGFMLGWSIAGSGYRATSSFTLTIPDS